MGRPSPPPLNRRAHRNKRGLRPKEKRTRQDFEPVTEPSSSEYRRQLEPRTASRNSEATV